MRRAGIALMLGGLGVLSFAATPVQAEFGAIRLLSKSTTEQADAASASAISADGHYIAFVATIGGTSGVFREDLASGALAPAAVGEAEAPGSPGADSLAPSIAADGRYVAFTTATPLDPAHDPGPGSSDVYVADMSVSPPTYELASALDGSAQGLTYEGSGGSQASGGIALSADGRRVVFVTSAASDLGGTAGDTPAGQVVLRNLDTEATTLVSVAREPGTGAMEPGEPVAGGAVPDAPQLPLSKGAAISADGTTVAWPGAHLPAQVPMLSDELATVEKLDENPENAYSEPLWRRVADGPAAPTRRIVGGGDPFAPGCPGTGGTLGIPACRGPFPSLTEKNTGLIDTGNGWMGASNVDAVPRLSADGHLVALIGNPTEATNVFLVDMAAGLSRVAAMRQLTREIQIDPLNPASGVNQEPYVPLNGHIFDLGFAADGRRIAFTTARQRFPLAPPNLVGSVPVSIGLVELYLIDLGGETLRRVTHGFGGPGEASLASNGNATEGAGATSPALDAGGEKIAFASTASNLVDGDGNDSSDVFSVTDDLSASGPVGIGISPPPRSRRAKHPWRLTVSAFSLPDGRVRLVAWVPGAGTLRARVKGSLQADQPSRALALAKARASNGGKQKLTLRLPPRLRRLAGIEEGVYAIARVSFRRKGRAVLRDELQVRFHAHEGKRGRGGAR